MITVGDEITCPTCGKVMLRCIEEPVIGALDWERFFECVEYKGETGDLMACPHDGAAWCVHGLGVHTKNGWGW